MDHDPFLAGGAQCRPVAAPSMDLHPFRAGSAQYRPVVYPTGLRRCRECRVSQASGEYQCNDWPSHDVFLQREFTGDRRFSLGGGNRHPDRYDAAMVKAF